MLIYYCDLGRTLNLVKHLWNEWWNKISAHREINHIVLALIEQNDKQFFLQSFHVSLFNLISFHFKGLGMIRIKE